MRIGFVTCADLSRYFVSKNNSLLTHDDQIACDYLKSKGVQVEPVIWGTNAHSLRKNFDLMIIRSPWDYMDTETTRINFFQWLGELAENDVRVLNDIAVLKWSLDKHYLHEIQELGASVVPTLFVEVDSSQSVLEVAFNKWKQIVIKPCISAAAKDTFRVRSREELAAFIDGHNSGVPFETLRKGRSFLVQPYLNQVENDGEWSLIFLDECYSHAVLKKPKIGHWLVQDELGGSVTFSDAPPEIRRCAEMNFAKLKILLKQRFTAHNSYLLYARIDIMPGLYIGEIELVEPELFFLDRRSMTPYLPALEKFHQGILRHT